MVARRLLRPCLVVLSLAGSIALSGRARAHDIPNARIERSTQVTLSSGHLRVDYEVVLAELTLAQDLRQLEGESFAGDRAELFDRYARVVGPLNARGFLVRVGDREVDLGVVGYAVVVEDHPRFQFHFEAEIPDRGRLSIVDTNYASSEGAARLALRVGPGVEASGTLPPPEVESIPFVPPWQQTDEAERRSKRLVVEYRPRAGTPGPVEVPAAPPPPPAPTRDSGLTRLLDHSTGALSVGWLLTAFLLGMVHALQPGHGKTLVAAASLDGPDASRRGVLLGLVTAACHLVGVVGIAGLLWSFDTNRFGAIHVVVARAAGFLIAAVGLYRVGRHLAGFDSSHDHAPRPSAGLWSLGLAAGFVPCWDAVALVVLANAIGQLAWGLTLLVVFSLGLAVVLVGVGWFAGHVRNRLRGGWATGPRLRWLGVASGLVLAAIGLGLLNS